jgi:hypothetical protein
VSDAALWTLAVLALAALACWTFLAGVWVGRRLMTSGLELAARHGTPVDLEGHRCRVVREQEYYAMRDALRRKDREGDGFPSRGFIVGLFKLYLILTLLSLFLWQVNLILQLLKG